MKSAGHALRWAAKEQRCGFSTRTKAFTLVELLVVLAVIALLAALVFSGTNAGLRSVRSAKSVANMKQLAGAYINCAADNNGQFPSYRVPGKGLQPTWDLQCFPYLGINDPDAYAAHPTAPVVKPSLDLDIFLCPLDTRKSDKAAGFYPRSYSVTYATVAHSGYTGGIPRTDGTGIRLVQIPKPASYVLLARVHRPWERAENVVGAFSRHTYSGLSPKNASNPVDADSWAIFGGKTPYAFADGHVRLVTPEQALLISPYDWNVNK